MAIRIRKPAADTPAEMTQDQIDYLLEQAEDLGVDVMFEMVTLGRAAEEVIASVAADREEWAVPEARSDPTPMLPARPVITRDSTREEVLAAVRIYDAEAAVTKAYLATLTFPDGPGCVVSNDGNVIACRGRGGLREEPEHLKRQRRAGEEDQDDGTWGLG